MKAKDNKKETSGWIEFSNGGEILVKDNGQQSSTSNSTFIYFNDATYWELFPEYPEVKKLPENEI